MITEKLAKAYFWRSGSPPRKIHSGFVLFLRSLAGVQQSRQARIAAAFDFKTFPALQSWIRIVQPIGYGLERLAPALSDNGPNPEYPWPPWAPVDNPVRHQFMLWEEIENTAIGCQLVHVVGRAVERFPTFA